MSDVSKGVRDLLDLVTVLRNDVTRQNAEITHLRALCDRQSSTISLSQMRHGRILVGLERRNARQRRALAKLYRRRHHRNALITHLIAELATARREGMEQAAKIAEECYRQNGPLSQRGFPERYRAGLAAGAQAIAAAIRVAKGEVK